MVNSILKEDEQSSFDIDNLKKITGLEHFNNINYILKRIGKSKDSNINLILDFEEIEENFKDNPTIKVLVELINNNYSDHLNYKKQAKNFTEIQNLKIKELDNLVELMQSNQKLTLANNNNDESIDISYDSNEIQDI